MRRARAVTPAFTMAAFAAGEATTEIVAVGVPVGAGIAGDADGVTLSVPGGTVATAGVPVDVAVWMVDCVAAGAGATVGARVEGAPDATVATGTVGSAVGAMSAIAPGVVPNRVAPATRMAAKMAPAIPDRRAPVRARRGGMAPPLPSRVVRCPVTKDSFAPGERGCGDGRAAGTVDGCLRPPKGRVARRGRATPRVSDRRRRAPRGRRPAPY